MTSGLQLAPCWVFWKNRPPEVMARVVDSLLQFAGNVTRGVSPLGAQVCRRTPFKAKLTSSKYTRDAPLASFFFQLRCNLLPPGGHPKLMALCGASIRQLRTEPGLVEQLADVVAVIPDLEGLTDQVPDTAGGSGFISVSMRQWTLSEKSPKLSLLL